MGTHDHLYNGMPLEERKRLVPYMIDTQILHLRQVRSLIVKAHQRELAELDAWIKNCENSLQKETASGG